jgi:hypothetical protein
VVQGIENGAARLRKILNKQNTGKLQVFFDKVIPVFDRSQSTAMAEASERAWWCFSAAATAVMRGTYWVIPELGVAWAARDLGWLFGDSQDLF